jgi:molecular chaperone DnaK
VSARDKATGKEQKITITSSSGISKEEIERMVQEAKQHENEDRRTKEVIEKRNHLDSMIFSVEKALSENKEKLPADEVTKVEQAVQKAKDALKEHAENAEALSKATDELMQSSHKIAEIIYKQENDKQGGDSSSPSSSSQEPTDNNGPIDADIE